MGKPVGSRLGWLVRKIQFLLPKNGRESLELVSKMGFNKWYSNYCLEYSIRKNRTTFTDGRCSRKFSAATQKGVLRLLSNRIFWLTTSIFGFVDPILTRSCKSHKPSREAKWPDRAVAGTPGWVHLYKIPPEKPNFGESRFQGGVQIPSTT